MNGLKHTSDDCKTAPPVKITPRELCSAFTQVSSVQVLFCVLLGSTAFGQTGVDAGFGYSDPWSNYRSPSVVSPSTFQSSVPYTAEAPCATATGCEPVTGCDCCAGPCDECGRKLAVDVGAVFLHRSRPSGQTLFFNSTAPLEQIDASEFDFGFSSGLQIGVIAYDQESLTDIEFRGAWTDEWSSGVTQNFTGPTVQISANPPLATTGPRTGFLTYNSQFWTAEVNARYRLRRLSGTTLLAGFRTMRLDEQLNGTLIDPAGAVPDELIQTKTQNRLFGFQIGADYVFRNCCNWCLKMNARAGMYGNDGNQKGNLISLAAPPVVFPAQGGAGDLAFHAEFGFEGKIRISNCVNLVGGYRVMLIDGLSLASEQLAATNFPAQSGYDSSGSVVLQEISIGVEVAY